MDDETKDTLESMTKAVHALAGRLLLIQAQLDVLQKAFLSAQKKQHSTDVDALQEVLQKGRQALAETYLTSLGDVHPETSEAMDVQGLLAKTLKRLKSQTET